MSRRIKHTHTNTQAKKKLNIFGSIVAGSGVKQINIDGCRLGARLMVIFNNI